MMNKDIEDFFAEEDEIIQSAVQRKEKFVHDQHTKELYFLTRNTALQNYYIRLSWENKKSFFVSLLGKIRGLDTILRILHVMAVRALKCIAYEFVDPNTGCVQAKLFLDHNRMLDEEVLKKTMEDDIDWFTTLDDESQITVIQGLLRLTAGVAKRAMYIPIWRRYFELLKEMKLLLAGESVTMTEQGEYICYSKKAVSEGVEFDPTHPADIEVQRLRKEWDNMIDKYKKDVHETTRVLRLVAGLEDKRKRHSADKEEKAKKKKVKPSQRGKGSSNLAKAVQVEKITEIDVIQLIPIWIVKNIFSFLDAKSLQSCKKVNKYWGYVVQDMMKEEKTRQQLNKQLESIKQSIGEDKLHEVTNRLRGVTTNVRKKNKDIMYHLSGAIAEKLVPKPKANLKETSLLEKAIKEMPDEYEEKMGLVTFPRLIKSDMDMYRFKSCFLRDVNVVFNVDQDVERQKSLLTYSLASIIGSLKIDVDQSVLAEW
nr:unnamed protein product [Callosobruchus chinensis]